MKDQRRFFDQLISEDCTTYVSEAWDYAREFEVRRLFKTVRPAAILDVGCGCGFHDRVMAEYAFVSKVDAIDYSEMSIQTANKVYPHQKVTRTVAAFEEFKTGERYDLVVGFQVFEHLHNPEQYLDFCVEHCAPFGHVAISTPNRLRLQNRISILIGKAPVVMDVMHYKEYTVKDIQEMGRAHGLEPFDWFGYGLAPASRLGFKREILLGYCFHSVAERIVVVLEKSDGGRPRSRRAE